MRARVRQIVGRLSLRGWLWSAFGIAWACAVLAGTVWLMAYDARPGEPAQAPSAWPAASHIARDPGGPTLVLIAHPQCDCTRASLAELAELLARAPRPPRAYVLFIHPRGMSNEWVRNGIWQAAASIPGVTLMLDEGGQQAKQFGTRTSGQTLLYDADGRLVFSGGDTRARGVEGESVGFQALLAILNGEHPRTSTTPVFGCELFDVNDASQQESRDVHRD